MSTATQTPKSEAFYNLSNPEVPALDVYPISSKAWGVLCLAVLVTFIAFVGYDPNPSLLLSVCAAANVGIVLWGIYRLYAWDLLLSPMASMFIGLGWIVFYSWGNLGARLAGDARRGGLYAGNLAYFPKVALLSTIGLILYCWVVFGLFPRQARQQRIRYSDLVWEPWQAIASGLVASTILWYLSSKYPFTGGYFRSVPVNSVDQWFAVSIYGFINLAIMINISVFFQGQYISRRILGAMIILILVIITISLRSRTFMIQSIINTSLFFIALKPRQIRSTMLLMSAGIIVVFVFGTVIKFSSSTNRSIMDNLGTLLNADLQTLQEQNKENAAVDVEYRAAGFEYSAAVLRALEKGGVSPYYGSGILGGIQNLPAFFRPVKVIGNSEREAIYLHFSPQWIPTGGELMSTTLTSGLAMFGFPFGVFIYFLAGLYVLFVGNLVQSTPRLYVAYLMAGMGRVIGDLFWDSTFVLIKFIGFAWLFLLIFGPIMMPRRIKGSQSNNSVATYVQRILH